MNKIIIMTGMPGAGKGVYNRVMGWLPNISSLSTGDLFRKLDPESDLGKKVNEIMTAGGFVGDDIVNEMVKPYLVPGKDILLDGFPRSVIQAEWLLNEVSGKFEIVTFLINLDFETADKRRLKRIEDYKLLGKEPRADDIDPTIIQKRFAEYREKTEPTIEFLRQKLGDKFFDIDGKPAIEDVYDSIMKIYTVL